MDRVARIKLPIAFFALIVWLAAAVAVFYAYSLGGPASILRRSTSDQFGRLMAGVGFAAIALVYARTALKLLVLRSDLWSRLAPFQANYAEIRTGLGRILYWLNKTHPYLGVVAVAAIFLHCSFTYRPETSVLLWVLLALLFLEGLTGFLMKMGFGTPGFVKRGYLWHSQLLVGILILILAAIGHALL